VNSPARQEQLHRERLRQEQARNEGADLPEWMSGVVAAGILIVYAILPTKNYYWDGVAFAQNIEQASGVSMKAPLFWTSIIHPNHLVYNSIGCLVWNAARSLGFHVRAIAVLQAMNMVAAAACAWLMQRILLRTTHSAYLSTTLTLLFAFSAIFWKYSTDSDAYILSVLCLMGAFYVLIATREPCPLMVGLLHAAAMLIHQLAFLFFPAAVLGLFLKGGWKAVWRYCVIAGGITLPAYYAGFWLEERETNPADFLRWLTSHSPEVSFSFNLPRNVAITISSYSRLFFGGTGHVLRYFGPFMLVTLILLAVVLARLIILFVRYRADLRLLPHLDWASDSVRVAIAWLSAYVVFLFFWLPHNTFYKLFCLPAIIFLLGQYLARYSGPRRNRLALFVATMALANLALYIFPYSRADYNQALRFATRMRPLWPSGTVVYYGEYTVDDWFIRYFNPQTVWKPMNPRDRAGNFAYSALNDLEAGREVWVDTTAAETLTAAGAGSHFDATQQDNYPTHPIRFFRWSAH
jgi:hypothetical protein